MEGFGDDRKRPREDSDDDMQQVQDGAGFGGNGGMFGDLAMPMAVSQENGFGMPSQGAGAGAPAAAASAADVAIPTDLLSEDLRTLLESLDDFVPTIPEAVTTYYLHKSGFNTSDPRIVKLIALATQKFISDIAQDAFQHCKQHRKASKHARGPQHDVDILLQEKDLVLTTADLTAALKDHGINVVKPPYFV